VLDLLKDKFVKLVFHFIDKTKLTLQPI